MVAVRSHHARVLAQLIAERRQLVLEALATGMPQQNYWQSVGQIQGLDDALKMSEEADYKLTGDVADVGA